MKAIHNHTNKVTEYFLLLAVIKDTNNESNSQPHHFRLIGISVVSGIKDTNNESNSQRNALS